MQNKSIKTGLDRGSRAIEVYKLLKKEFSGNSKVVDCVANKGIKIKQINPDMMLFHIKYDNKDVRYFYNRIEIVEGNQMTVWSFNRSETNVSGQYY